MDGKVTLEIITVIGIFLGLFWLAFLALVSVGCRVWDWIDDREVPTLNPVVKFLMVNVFGYKLVNCASIPYGREDLFSGSFGGAAFLYPALAFALFPFAVYFYEISLFLISLVCIALLARFARRAKKAIDSHVKDKDAHK